MSGMRVIDAHLHIGGRHLQPLKVYHQLAVAGIKGATFLAGPEHRDFPCGSTDIPEVNDGWRHPRYLTRRGILHQQEYPYPWLPTIPATPLHHGGVRMNRWFSPCDDIRPKYNSSLVADGNERFTWAFASAYATARILEDLQGFDPASPRACFRSRRLWEVACHTGSPRGRREFRFSLVVSVVPTGCLASRG